MQELSQTSRPGPNTSPNPTRKEAWNPGMAPKDTRGRDLNLDVNLA